jgi:hypothetical protein
MTVTVNKGVTVTPMSTNEEFEDVLQFWFSSLQQSDHAAMVRQME